MAISVLIDTQVPLADAGFIPRKAESLFVQDVLRPLFVPGRETFLIAAFDYFGRLVTLQQASDGRRDRCTVPARIWRALFNSQTSSVLIAHNHLSGVALPSNADKRCTKAAVNF